MSLTLLLPVYNGAHHLKETFDRLDAWCTAQRETRVLFINDGSTDETQILLEGFKEGRDHVSILSFETNRGKGTALREGIRHIEHGTIVGFTDIDLPYGLEEIPAVLDHIANGADVVIGDRSRKEHQYSWYRKLAHIGFRQLLPQSLRTFRDTQSGFKFFTRDAAQIIFNRVETNRWVFDLELLLTAKGHDFTIVSHPVSMRKKPSGRGGIHLLREGRAILSDILRIRKYDRLGKYSK